MKAEVDEVNRANNKMRKAFIELLEAHQLELDQRDNQFYDRQEMDYYWLDKAGILD
jgi:aminopeptidase C